MGLTYAEDDNQIRHFYSSSVDLIQNISSGDDRKADDCNAARGASFDRQRTFFALAWTLLDSTRGFSLKGDFDHAVDDSGDSSGFVVNRLALERWRQSHSPAARSSRGCFDY
jgi:hypothetical protein